MARSFRRLPPEQQKDGEGFLKVRGVPWQWTPDGPSASTAAIGAQILMDAEPAEGDLPEAVSSTPSRPVPRKLYLRKKDLSKYGVTPGCPGCRSSAAGTQPVAHWDSCRERIVEAMRAAGDTRRLEETEHKITEELAQRVEEGAEGVFADRAKRIRAEGEVLALLTTRPCKRKRWHWRSTRRVLVNPDGQEIARSPEQQPSSDRATVRVQATDQQRRLEPSSLRGRQTAVPCTR